MKRSNMQELLPDEVITLEPGYYINRPTNRVSEVHTIINSRISNDIEMLFSEDGIECQVLRLGAPEWKSGRLRLMLLFEEDEPEEESLPDDELNESLSELQRLADG